MKHISFYSTFALLLTNSLGAVTPAVTIQISPTTATLRVGQTRDFNTYIANTTDKTVAWFVNSIEGGNTTVGTIDKDGIYKPPATIPAANIVTIKVVPTADKTKFSTAAVTLENAIPTFTKLTPSPMMPNSPAYFSVRPMLSLPRNFGSSHQHTSESRARNPAMSSVF